MAMLGLGASAPTELNAPHQGESAMLQTLRPNSVSISGEKGLEPTSVQFVKDVADRTQEQVNPAW